MSKDDDRVTVTVAGTRYAVLPFTAQMIEAIAEADDHNPVDVSDE